MLFLKTSANMMKINGGQMWKFWTAGWTKRTRCFCDDEKENTSEANAYEPYTPILHARIFLYFSIPSIAQK